jgi:hypothetical protein
VLWRCRHSVSSLKGVTLQLLLPAPAPGSVLAAQKWYPVEVQMTPVSPPLLLLLLLLLLLTRRLSVHCRARCRCRRRARCRADPISPCLRGRATRTERFYTCVSARRVRP